MWRRYQESSYSGVFSTGATGAIAPVILRKKANSTPNITPALFSDHIIVPTLRKNFLFLQPFRLLRGKLLQNFLLRFARMSLNCQCLWYFGNSIGKRIQKDKFKNFHKINFNALVVLTLAFTLFSPFFFVASSNHFFKTIFTKKILIF